MLKWCSAKLVTGEAIALGTAWLVSPDMALTALHCLPPDIIRQGFRLQFPDAVLNAVILWSDRTVDAAILCLSQEYRFPPGYGPVPMRSLPGDSAAGVVWSAFGFPIVNPNGLTVSGTLDAAEAGAVQLLCMQGVDETALKGMSGAAVRVNDSAVAVIVSGPPRLKQRVLFATPIEAIIERALISGKIERQDHRAVLSSLSPVEIDDYDKAFSDYLGCVRDLRRELPQSFLGSPVAGSEECSDTGVYIPLQVRPVQHVQPVGPSADYVGDFCATASELNCGVLSVRDSIRSAFESRLRHVLFFGDPGSGKSSLLRCIAADAWDNPERIGFGRRCIPILVRLSLLAECKPNSLDAWLWDAMSRSTDLMQVTPPPGFFQKWTSRANATWLIILDGFDEIPSNRRGDLAQLIEKIVRRPEFNCIMSSRHAHGFEDEILPLCRHFATYEILPLNSEQEIALTKKWVGDDSALFSDQLANLRFNASKKTPLLIAVAASIFRRFGTLPESRAELYERLVCFSLNEARRKGLDRELGAEIAPLTRSLLEHLALETLKQEHAQSVEQLARIADPYLRSAVRLTTEQVRVLTTPAVNAIARLSGIICVENEDVRWWHQTIQEYLAACRIVSGHSDAEIYELASTNWNQEPWSSVLLFVFVLMQRRFANLDEATNFTTELFATIQNEAENSATEGLGARVGLFLAAALAEGAPVSTNAEELIIDFLHGSALLGGKNDFCKQVYADLANSGRSPIDLLGRLTRFPSAVWALRDIITREDLEYWARESAALAALRACLIQELRDIMKSNAIPERIKELIMPRLSTHRKRFFFRFGST